MLKSSKVSIHGAFQTGLIRAALLPVSAKKLHNGGTATPRPLLIMAASVG